MLGPPGYNSMPESNGSNHAHNGDLMDIDTQSDRTSEFFFDMESDNEDTPEHLPPPPPQPGASSYLTHRTQQRHPYGGALPFTEYPPLSQHIEHPLAESGSEPPPPTYGHVIMQPELCIICKTRPAFKDSYRAFPTCGNTCARKLKERQPATAAESSRAGASSYLSGGYQSHAHNLRSRSPFSAGPVKMCTVCKTRPRYEKGGKVFPTCGLTCAAKLNPQEKCEVCKTRARESKSSPYCGTVCRQKASEIVTAAINSSTCTTCLVCWRANQSDNDFVCSPPCREALTTHSPCLLEIPRGHVMFKKVNNSFTLLWKDPKTPCPNIKKLYKVNLPDAFHAAHLQYQTAVEQERNSLRGKSNEQRRFLGFSRNCGFGDTGNTRPCSSRTCILCCIMQMSVHPDDIPHGIGLTSLAERAVEKSINKKNYQDSKVVLIADVTLGNEVELSINDELKLDHGQHSIKLLNYRTGWSLGRSSMNSHYGESVVFNGKAILPQFLVLFA